MRATRCSVVFVSPDVSLCLFSRFCILSFSCSFPPPTPFSTFNLIPRGHAPEVAMRVFGPYRGIFSSYKHPGQFLSSRAISAIYPPPPPPPPPFFWSSLVRRFVGGLLVSKTTVSTSSWDFFFPRWTQLQLLVRHWTGPSPSPPTLCV